MKTKLTNWLIILGLFMTLSSCEDHRIPVGQRFRIKKFTNHYDGTYNVLTYGSNGKVADVARYTSSGVAAGGLALYYDGQGNLQKSERQDKLGDPSTTTVQYTYGVDANGNIIAAERRDVSILGEFTKEQYQLTYGSTSKVPNRSVVVTGSPAAQRLYTYVDYVYSSENVVTIATRVTYNTGYDLSNSTRTYQYDTKPNPFYGLILGSPDISLYGIVGNNAGFIKLLSKNNVIDSDYVYAYDANGYLMSISLPDGRVQNSFEYEAY